MSATRIYRGIIGRPILVPVVPFDSHTTEENITALFAGQTVTLVWKQTDDDGAETSGVWAAEFVDDEDAGQAVKYTPASGAVHPLGKCDVYIAINGTIIDRLGPVNINFFE